MATLDELLSQETKPESHLSEPLAGAYGDLHGLGEISSAGSSGKNTIDYTINIDTTVLTELFEKFNEEIVSLRNAMARLEAAVADLQEEEDDEEVPAFYGGHWNIDPGSLYVSNGTNMEWKNVGEVTSASVTLGVPLEEMRSALGLSSVVAHA